MFSKLIRNLDSGLKEDFFIGSSWIMVAAIFGLLVFFPKSVFLKKDWYVIVISGLLVVSGIIEFLYGIKKKLKGILLGAVAMVLVAIVLVDTSWRVSTSESSHFAILILALALQFLGIYFIKRAKGFQYRHDW